MLTPHAKEAESDGKRILSVWNIAQGRVIKDVPGPFPEKAIQFNGAFNFAASKDGSSVAVVSALLPQQPVTVYSAKEWTVTRQFPMASGASSLAFSADGKRLAIGRVDGAVEVYDLSSKDSAKRVLVGYDPRMSLPISALAFSPDGNFLAGGARLTIKAYNSVASFKLWRLSDLSLVMSDLAGVTPVRQISWSRDGTYVTVAGGDRKVRLGSPIAHPYGGWMSLPFSDAVMSLGFSPLEAVLAVASGPTIKVFGMPR